MKNFYLFSFSILLSFFAQAQQPEQITVMSYNLLNYRNATSYCTFNQNNPLTKEAHLKTIAQHINPDILVCNEIGDSPTNSDFILTNSLNVNGVSYYSKAAYSNNGFSSLVNMLFYNSEKFVLKSQTTVSKDLNGNNLVRVIDIYRLYYKDSLLTNQSDTVYVIVAAAHLKAGSSSSDLADRADAAQAFMSYLENAVTDENVILCGDLNIYKSQEQAYQYLTQYNDVPTRLYDPLNQPGNWGNNGSFAYLHTQSTRSSATNGGCFSSGGLDDRLDHILISDEIRDNVAKIKYVPNAYYALGNDGLHFNKAINDGTNNSVPANVLAALYGLSDHLPVIADFEITRQQIGLTENGLLPHQLKFANPVDNELRITLQNNKAIAPQMRIYNATGALFAHVNLEKNQSGWGNVLDVSALKNGIYFIEITTANGWRTVKKMSKQ